MDRMYMQSNIYLPEKCFSNILRPICVIFIVSNDIFISEVIKSFTTEKVSHLFLFLVLIGKTSS